MAIDALTQLQNKLNNAVQQQRRLFHSDQGGHLYDTMARADLDGDGVISKHTEYDILLVDTASIITEFNGSHFLQGLDTACQVDAIGEHDGVFYDIAGNNTPSPFDARQNIKHNAVEILRDLSLMQSLSEAMPVSQEQIDDIAKVYAVEVLALYYPNTAIAHEQHVQANEARYYAARDIIDAMVDTLERSETAGFEIANIPKIDIGEFASYPTRNICALNEKAYGIDL